MNGAPCPNQRVLSGKPEIRSRNGPVVFGIINNAKAHYSALAFVASIEDAFAKLHFKHQFCRDNAYRVQKAITCVGALPETTCFQQFSVVRRMGELYNFLYKTLN